MLEMMVFMQRGLVEALGIQETRHAMDSAAISILLGEEPPVDPVSGKPFVWDAGKRMLAPPDGSSLDKSLRVP